MKKIIVVLVVLLSLSPALSVFERVSSVGYKLRDKLDELKQAGVEGIIDVLGRQTSLKGITNALSIRPGVYFARLKDKVIKLVN